MELSFIVQSIVAGILATYVLLVLAIWNSRLGMPRLDFSAAMAAVTYGDSFEGQKPPYWAGMLVIYFNGVIFALLYSYAIGPHLPYHPLINGAIWGAVLWFISGIFYVPFILKEGFFLSHIHGMAWFASGIVHGAYGLMVGWLAPVAHMGS